jgi:hypothetical protein
MARKFQSLIILCTAYLSIISTSSVVLKELVLGWQRVYTVFTGRSVISEAPNYYSVLNKQEKNTKGHLVSQDQAPQTLFMDFR